MTCCQKPRHVIVKRWEMGGYLHTIERCRACSKWFRRKVQMQERNGRLEEVMGTSKLTEEQISSTNEHESSI